MTLALFLGSGGGGPGTRTYTSNDTFVVPTYATSLVVTIEGGPGANATGVDGHTYTGGAGGRCVHSYTPATGPAIGASIGIVVDGAADGYFTTTLVSHFQYGGADSSVGNVLVNPQASKGGDATGSTSGVPGHNGDPGFGLNVDTTQPGAFSSRTPSDYYVVSGQATASNSFVSITWA